MLCVDHSNEIIPRFVIAHTERERERERETSAQAHTYK
jgi:hypothetical protein